MFKLICGIFVGSIAVYFARNHIKNAIYVLIMYLQSSKDR